MCTSLEYIEDVPVVSAASAGDCPECHAVALQVIDRCVWTESMFAYATRECCECGAEWEVVFRPCAVRVHH